jgi:hypothetical protein
VSKTQFARGGAVLLLVTYWAGTTLGSQFSIDPPGPIYDVWYSAAPLVVGAVLAFAVAVYVARWWVVLAAAVPILVLGGLELAGHTAPWHEAGPPLTRWLEYGFWSVLMVYVPIFVLPLVLGVAVRRGLGHRASAAAQF